MARINVRKPTTVDEYEMLLLRFVKSLCLCDHMGDVSNSIDDVFQILGIELDVEDLSLLYVELDAQDVKTLSGL